MGELLVDSRVVVMGDYRVEGLATKWVACWVELKVVDRVLSLVVVLADLLADKRDLKVAV